MENKNYIAKLFKKSLTLLLFIILTFVASKSSYASHMVGSDVSYQCTNTPGVYLVTAKVYRDCQGIQWCPNCPTALSPTCALSISITGAGGSCNGQNFGNQSIFVLPNVSGYDVVQLCAMSKTICSNCGTRTPGSFVPGIEVYTFQGNVDLRSLPPGCCDVNVGFSSCCRNAAITTLVNPSSLSMYVPAHINKCVTPCSSSPTFTNDPVAVACAGQDFSYNLGAIDPDGDSLSYEFGQGLTAPNSPVPYLSPYSPNAPFPYLGIPGLSPPLLPPAGINIDPVTGDLRFRPMGNFVSNLVIVVKQWRMIGGVPTLVGTTRRDLQFYSQNCASNNPPVLRTYDDNGTLTSPQPNFAYAVCANQQLCLIISAWDDVAAWDTTDMNWNNPNIMVANGATFVPLYNVNQRKILGPKLDSFRFCWTPPPSMASNLPYYFIVTAKDRACPIPARTTRSFSVIVRKVPLATITKQNKNCGYYDFSYNVTNSVPLSLSYTQWQVEQSPASGAYTVYNSQNVSNHFFSQGGWHRVKLRLTSQPPPNPNGCPNDFIIDSVFVPKPVKVTLRDTFNCLNTPVLMQAEGHEGVPIGLGYRYYFYSGPMTSTTVMKPIPWNPNSVDSFISINPPSTGITSYKVVITDLNGCKDSVPFQVLTRPLPLRELMPKIRICSYQDTVLDAGTGNAVSIWRWTKSPVTPTLADTISQRITVKDSGTYVVRKIDGNGCTITDTTKLYVNPLPPVTAGPDRSICFNDPLIKIQASTTGGYIDSFYWSTFSNPAVMLSDRDTLVVSPPATTVYRVRGMVLYDNVKCYNTSTMNLTVNTLPIINRPVPTPLCKNSKVVSLPLINSTNKQLASRIWSYPPNPSAINSNQVFIDSLKWLPPPTGSVPYGSYIFITATDTNGCKVKDSLLLAIFPVPIIDAGPNKRLCDISGIYSISPGTQGYTPNGGVTGLNEFWYGNGVFQPIPTQNKYSFDPLAPGVKLLPDTNIITYEYRVLFPPTNPVTFSPPLGGVSIASPVGGCPAVDTTVFRVIKSPILKAGNASPVCKSSDTINLDTWMVGRNTTAIPQQTSYWFFAPVDAMYAPALTGGRKFNPSHPIIPNITKTYKLMYGDTATTCKVYDSTTIQVNENPVVNIDFITASDSAVCQSQNTVTFYMNPANQSPVDGQMFSNPPLPNAFNVTLGTFNLNDPQVVDGVYNVKYYFKDPSTGCTNRDSINIRVQLPPKIDITDDGTVCADGAMFTVGFKVAPKAPYGTLWTTPDGDNFAIVNNPPFGISYTANAMDIARGTITFRATTTNNGVCPAVFDQATYVIKPKPYAEFSCVSCFGCVDPRKGIELNPSFTSSPTGVPAPNFYWYVNNPALTTPANTSPPTDDIYTRKFATWGNYPIQLIVEALGCYDTSAVQMVEAWPTPIADFVSDKESTTIAKPFFDFFDRSSIANGTIVQYIWNLHYGPNGPPERISNEINPKKIVFPSDTAKIPIRLTVVSDKGCIDSTVRWIRIDPDITVFIPNVFYPGSSVSCAYNCNKTFKIAAHGFETIEIFVFNRWGQMVYKSNDPHEGWNGRTFNSGDINDDCQQDAYIYQVNATSFGGKKYSYSGSITLLR